MQIFLHVEKGPHIGRRLAIRSGQVASFGKTERSDHCLEQDVELADQHFRIQVKDTCTIEAIESDAEFLVNGETPENSSLVNGDIISAGLSVFRVEVEGEMISEHFPEPSPSESNSNPVVEFVDLPQLCADLDLGEEALAEASKHNLADGFLKGLIEAKLFNDAIRLHVHLMLPADAIQWAVASIQALLNNNLTPLDSDAIQKAADWASDPSEASRRLCGRIAEEREYEGIGGTLALAVFISGGNIAPEDLEGEVQPEPFSFGQATAGAVMLATVDIHSDDADELIGSILKPSD